MVGDKVLKKGSVSTQGQENEQRALGYIIWQMGGPLANKDVRNKKSGLGAWLEDGTIKERQQRGTNSRKSIRVRMELKSTS